MPPAIMPICLASSSIARAESGQGDRPRAAGRCRWERAGACPPADFDLAAPMRPATQERGAARAQGNGQRVCPCPCKSARIGGIGGHEPILTLWASSGIEVETGTQLVLATWATKTSCVPVSTSEPATPDDRLAWSQKIGASPTLSPQPKYAAEVEQCLFGKEKRRLTAVTGTQTWQMNDVKVVTLVRIADGTLEWDDTATKALDVNNYTFGRRTSFRISDHVGDTITSAKGTVIFATEIATKRLGLRPYTVTNNGPSGIEFTEDALPEGNNSRADAGSKWGLAAKMMGPTLGANSVYMYVDVQACRYLDQANGNKVNKIFQAIWDSPLQTLARNAIPVRRIFRMRRRTALRRWEATASRFAKPGRLGARPDLRVGACAGVAAYVSAERCSHRQSVVHHMSVGTSSLGEEEWLLARSWELRRLRRPPGCGLAFPRRGDAATLGQAQLCFASERQRTLAKRGPPPRLKLWGRGRS